MERNATAVREGGISNSSIRGFLTFDERGKTVKSTVKNPSRRRFLRSSAQAGVGTLALGLFAAGAVATAKPAKVSENGAFARQLHYLEDASQEKVSAYKKGQTCANCLFYKGKQGSQWGPCQIFGGRLVNANGWCTLYQAGS